ncbi:MAG: HAD family hydrolase [Vulcanimicrobiota bacterium]
MIKAVIFDFDGVLVESVDIKTKAFGQLFESEGEDIVKKVIDYHLLNTGVSRFDKFKYIYKEFLKRPLPNDEFEKLCSQFANLFMENVVKAPYVKGAREFIEKHHNDLLLFVASATPQKEIEEIVTKRYMRHYFKKVYGAPKSKSDAAQEVLNDFSFHHEEAVFIGDALSDHKAAQNNNLFFIARMSGDPSLFDGIDCIKLPDLQGIETVINGL